MIPDRYEDYLAVLEKIDAWYRSQAARKSGPLEQIPTDIVGAVLEGACPYCPESRLRGGRDPEASRFWHRHQQYQECPCCGFQFSLHQIESQAPAGSGKALTEAHGHDRCGHVVAFLLPRGMALTGGYLSPTRDTHEQLRQRGPGLVPPSSRW